MIPLGWENPLRLAEDLATVDVLSGGRLNPGVSVGPPMHWDDVKDALYPDTADAEDFSYERVARLLRLVDGQPASSFSGKEGVVEEWSDRVQPHSPGLRGRLWYGGASLGSARWAGEHGMNFLTSSVVKVEDPADGPLDFAAIQRAQIRAFREASPAGAAARVSQGLVVIPDRQRDCGAAGEVRRLRRGARPADDDPAGAGPAAVRAGSPGHLGADRRGPVRARRVPGGHRGRVRPAVQLRGRGLRPDAHRHRDPARAGPGLAAARGRLTSGSTCGAGPYVQDGRDHPVRRPRLNLAAGTNTGTVPGR